MTKIDDIVAKLSKSYHAEKEAKKEKEQRRADFFQTITDQFSEDDLAEDLAVVEADSEEEAYAQAEANYPTYNVIAAREHPDLEGRWEVIIQENPEYKSFSITVEGEIWQRQTSVGAPMVDDEKLAAEDPELYELVTEVPTKRVMKPLKDLDDVSLARLQKYVVPGKVSLKLPAPKVNK